MVACRGARFVPAGRLPLEIGNVVDFCAREALVADPSQDKVSEASKGVDVFINGEVDVR